MTNGQILEAAKKARTFQMMALFHLDHPREDAFQRDGQALIDALWALGFRAKE